MQCDVGAHRSHCRPLRSATTRSHFFNLAVRVARSAWQICVRWLSHNNSMYFFGTRWFSTSRSLKRSISLESPPPVWPLCYHTLGGPQVLRRWRGVELFQITWGRSSCSEVTCPGYQRNEGAVFDVRTEDVKHTCISCNHRVECLQEPTSVPADAVCDRFTSGPLCHMFTHV